MTIAFSTSERFAHLEHGEKERLDVLTKLDSFAAGEEVHAAGAPSEWLRLLVTGGVDIRVPGRSGEVTVARLGPGDLVGELETFADLPAGVRLVAREETIARAIAKNPLKQELRAHRPLATALLFVYSRSISEKIRALNDFAMSLRPAPAAPPPAEPAEHQPDLTEEEARWLEMLGTSVQAPEGAVVVKEGDTSQSFYVIDTGTLEVRKRSESGEERRLARLGPRDLFGFMAFLDGKPRSASVAVAAGPALLTQIEPAALQQALGVNFTVGFKFLGTLCTVLGRTFCNTARQIMAAAP